MTALILKRASASRPSDAWDDDEAAGGPEGETSGPAAPAAEKGQTSRLEVPPKYYGPCTVQCLARQAKGVICAQCVALSRAWMWTSGHNATTAAQRTAMTVTRESAMAAFAKSWRRTLPLSCKPPASCQLRAAA